MRSGDRCGCFAWAREVPPADPRTQWSLPARTRGSTGRLWHARARVCAHDAAGELEFGVESRASASDGVAVALGSIGECAEACGGRWQAVEWTGVVATKLALGLQS